MRRILYLLLFGVVFLCSCGSAEDGQKGKRWDCSVENVSGSADVIHYSETEMQTDSGQLGFQNRNDFPIHVYLYSGGTEETLIFDSDVEPGGMCVFMHANPDDTYTVGVRAEAAEGTSIVMMAYDGDAVMEPY